MGRRIYSVVDFVCRLFLTATLSKVLWDFVCSVEPSDNHII